MQCPGMDREGEGKGSTCMELIELDPLEAFCAIAGRVGIVMAKFPSQAWVS